MKAAAMSNVTPRLGTSCDWQVDLRWEKPESWISMLGALLGWVVGKCVCVCVGGGHIMNITLHMYSLSKHYRAYVFTV